MDHASQQIVRCERCTDLLANRAYKTNLQFVLDTIVWPLWPMYGVIGHQRWPAFVVAIQRFKLKRFYF